MTIDKFELGHGAKNKLTEEIYYLLENKSTTILTEWFLHFDLQQPKQVINCEEYALKLAEALADYGIQLYGLQSARCILGNMEDYEFRNFYDGE